MGSLVLSAFALMLVFEGLMPFLSPTTWRAMLEKLMLLSDGQLRFLGLCSMGAGLLLLLLFM